MSFLDGKPRVATEDECKAPWYGYKNGAHFRCMMCGHRFKPGDTWRCVYTNDTLKAGGNPLICEKCDGPDVKQRWIEKCERYWADDNWYFRRQSHED